MGVVDSTEKTCIGAPGEHKRAQVEHEAHRLCEAPESMNAHARHVVLQQRDEIWQHAVEHELVAEMRQQSREKLQAFVNRACLSAVTYAGADEGKVDLSGSVAA